MNTGQANSRSRRPQGSRSAFVIYSRSGSTGGKARQRAKAGTRADRRTQGQTGRRTATGGDTSAPQTRTQEPSQPGDGAGTRAPAPKDRHPAGPGDGITKRGGGGAGTPQTRTQKRAPGLRVNLWTRERLPAERHCCRLRKPSGRAVAIYRDKIFSYGCDFLLRYRSGKSQCAACNNAQKRLKTVVFFFFYGIFYFVVLIVPHIVPSDQNKIDILYN